MTYWAKKLENNFFSDIIFFEKYLKKTIFFFGNIFQKYVLKKIYLKLKENDYFFLIWIWIFLKRNSGFLFLNWIEFFFEFLYLFFLPFFKFKLYQTLKFWPYSFRFDFYSFRILSLKLNKFQIVNWFEFSILPDFVVFHTNLLTSPYWHCASLLN